MARERVGESEGQSPSDKASEAGFTFVEAIVALGLAIGLALVLMQLAAHGQRVSRAQPAAADLQQRLRVTAEMIQRDLTMAGAGPLHGAGVLAGSLAEYVPAVVPARTGTRAPDPELSWFGDRISLDLRAGWWLDVHADGRHGRSVSRCSDRPGRSRLSRVWAVRVPRGIARRHPRRNRSGRRSRPVYRHRNGGRPCTCGAQCRVLARLHSRCERGDACRPARVSLRSREPAIDVVQTATSRICRSSKTSSMSDLDTTAIEAREHSRRLRRPH